jgi:hypothetical protein
MPLSIVCPGCGATLGLPEGTFASIRCPKCRHVFAVAPPAKPAAAAPPPDPVPVPAPVAPKPEAAVPAPPVKPSRRVRRTLAAAALLALFCSGGVVGVCWWLWPSRPPTQEVVDEDGADTKREETVPAGPGQEAEAAGVQPAPLSEERVVRLLPGAVSDVAVGGRGRYLILSLPALDRLAVFDVNTARVVKYIPSGGKNAKFAAGADKLLVVRGDTDTIERWSLTSLEREASSGLAAAASVSHLCLGSASTGPALFARDGTGPGLIDPGTLRISPLVLQQDRNVARPGDGGPVLAGGGMRGQSWAKILRVRASANGQVFGIQDEHGRGWALVPGAEGNSAPTLVPSQGNVPLPSPDGSMLYAGAGVFSRDGKPLGASVPGEQALLLPGCHGPYYLRLEPGEAGHRTPTVFMTGDARPLLRLPQVEVAFGPADFRATDLAADQRIHLIPAARLIVTIPATNDRLVLHRFDVEEALEKSGVDYLLVTSRPPTTAARGTTYTHQLTVRSRQGGAKCRLESGPANMSLTPAGLLNWPVPAGHLDEAAVAILSVSDRSGQELFFTVKIAVVP